jgi:glycerol-3-phosphate dehydrogenase
VFRYTDARTDDAALTRAVMRSAQSLGAELCCPAEFIAAELTGQGVDVHFSADGVERTCHARVLINASGPWANTVLDRVSPAQIAVPVELVQGTHIEVSGSMGDDFYYVESPRDGRAVFVMPRDGRIVIGTTEKRYCRNPDHVVPLPGEEGYLLRVAAYYFPAFAGLRRQDLLASWAGLRVLPGGEGHAFHRSRETVLHTDRHSKPQVLTVYGGKLTSYRATAEKVAERIRESLPQRKPIALTSELPLTP